MQAQYISKKGGKKEDKLYYANQPAKNSDVLIKSGRPQSKICCCNRGAFEFATNE